MAKYDLIAGPKGAVQAARLVSQRGLTIGGTARKSRGLNSLTSTELSVAVSQSTLKTFISGKVPDAITLHLKCNKDMRISTTSGGTAVDGNSSAECELLTAGNTAIYPLADLMLAGGKLFIRLNSTVSGGVVEYKIYAV